MKLHIDGGDITGVRGFLRCVAVLLSLLAGKALATDYYVAPNGSNSNSGTLAQPFATIQQAANAAQPGDNVYIRGGTYRESVTLAHSGTAAAPINFAPYAGENVTVTGLDVLHASWSDYSGPIYQTTTGTGVSQVFLGGKMLTEARWPNPVYTNPLRAVAATVDSATLNSAANTATITDNALGNPAAGTWNKAKISIVSGITGASNAEWVAWGGTNVNQTGNKLTYAWPNTTSSYYSPTATNKYYLYGDRAALSGAQQWYQDPASGTLYIQTAGASPAGQQVEVRTRDTGMDFAGQSFVNVSGIRFMAANVLVSGNNNVVNNTQILYPVAFTGPTNWNTVNGVTVSGQNNTIRNSEIAYSWGEGVSLKNTNNTVDNNLIHDVDWGGSDSAPINTTDWGHNTITNNTIYNTGRPGIMFRNATPDTQILHNDVSRFGFLTKDLGGITTYTSESTGTEIAYNVVHDTRSTGLNVGIYPDAGTSGVLIHHNLVYNCQRGIQINKPATDDRIYNNTFWNVDIAVRSGFSGDYDVRTYNNLSNDNEWAGSSTSRNLTTTTDRFVNSAAGDFRLKSNSPAVDYGRVISGFPYPYSGSNPDAGAFEYDPANPDAPGWTAGASFKVWLFSNQRSAPLADAVTVNQATQSRVATGSLTVGNTGSTGNNNRAFIKFDLSEMAGDAIQQAVLRVYENGNGLSYAANNGDVTLHQIMADWTSTSVPFNQSVGPDLPAFYDPANLDLYTDIDVTPVVMQWLADPASNFGFSLRGTENVGNTAKYFDGYYGITPPQLIVTLAVPEPASLCLLAAAALCLLARPVQKLRHTIFEVWLEVWGVKIGSDRACPTAGGTDWSSISPRRAYTSCSLIGRSNRNGP